MTVMQTNPILPTRRQSRTARRPAGTRATLLLLAALSIGVAGCGGAESDAPGSAADDAAPERRPVVRVVEVRPESVVDMLHLPADLRPVRRASLAAEVAGTVETLRAPEGQRVPAGALLATIDTRALEQELAEARALYEQAQDEHQRAEALFERRSITRSSLVDTKARRDVAAARLASGRLRLEKSRLTAPWSGTVSEKRVEVGDYVTPGQPMIELVDASRLEVIAPVPASDVRVLEIGAPVTVRVSGFPEERFAGEVVRLAAELDPAERTLALEAELDNRSGRLRPGMLARIEIPRRRLPAALLVPLDAVIDMEDRKVVYVAVPSAAAEGTDAGAEIERREVALGPILGQRVVVERGLEPGDLVVVEGQSRVAPGQEVEVVETAATGPIDPLAPIEPAGAEAPVEAPVR